MAKLTDKFFNRVIVGDLEVTEAEAKKIAEAGVYPVDNVKTLSNEVIAQLKAGDIVVKKDASGNHPYIVSFRGETGICLTYADASVVETQSYDKVGNNWIYNSEDKWEMTKPIYCHPVFLNMNRTFDDYVLQVTMLIFNNSSTPFTKESFVQWCKDLFELNADARILTSGFYGTVPTSCFAKSATPSTVISIYIAGTNTAGTDKNINYSDIMAEDTIFNDGVNRIN